MQSADNFDFPNLVSQFLGYNSSNDRTKIDKGFLVRGSKNVYKKVSGTFAVRPGLKRRGTADATLAGVDSSYEWQTSVATERPLRVCNGNLQVESDVVTSGTYVWYTLLSSLTTTAWVFDTVWDNTLKKDFLVFVGGSSSLYRWEGGIAKISSTTINTIVLDRTVASAGFSTTSGSVIINGTTYTYSGSSASTLTGVAADPTGEAASSAVIAAVITNATTPVSGFTNDFLKVVNNQVYVGSYTSRLVYISGDASYINFSVPATRVAGDPELLTLDSLGKGIGVRQGAAHIFGGTQDMYIISFENIEIAAALTQQTKVDKKEMANLEAPLNHNFIAPIGDDIVWVSQKQQLKSYGTYRELNQPVFPTLSLAVEEEWKDEDFTDGHLRSVGETLYATSPNNGRVWLYQIRSMVDEQGNVGAERLWQPPFIWNLARIAVIDGVEYGHSNANPQIYEMWDTLQYHDDSPADEDLAYDCIAAFAYRQHGLREGLLGFDKYYVEGYISSGTELFGVAVLDYQGSSGVLESIINSSDSPVDTFSGSVGVSLGDSSLGDNPLGDSVSEEEADQDSLAKFRANVGVQTTDCFEYQLRLYSNTADARWEVLAIGANATKSTRKPTFVIK